MNIIWSSHTFDELTLSELYAALQLRQEIFVVEQNCTYLDCDDKDQYSHHLLGWHNVGDTKRLIAYLRIVSPKNIGDVPHIGRVLCHKSIRGTGIGKDLVLRGISKCNDLFPHQTIQISAQQYLLDFYRKLGFRVSSPPYDEDGIPHIEMVYDDVSFVPTDNS
jgi:ElaA protein